MTTLHANFENVSFEFKYVLNETFYLALFSFEKFSKKRYIWYTLYPNSFYPVCIKSCLRQKILRRSLCNIEKSSKKRYIRYTLYPVYVISGIRYTLNSVYNDYVYNDIPLMATEFHGPGHNASI